MKRGAFRLLAVAGCSNLLGLSPPQLATDAAAIDAMTDASTGDFTFEITTPHPRVPAGGFDFLDVVVTRAGVDGPITVSVPQPAQGLSVSPVVIDTGATTGELRIDGNQGLTLGDDLAVHVVATAGTDSHAVDLVVKVTALPGSLDPTFAGVGAATYNVGNLASSCNDLTIGSNGEIALFGQSFAGTVDGAILKLHGDGTVDQTFNTVHSDQGDTDPAHFACGALSADGTLAVGGGIASDLRTDSVGVAWLAAFNAAGAAVKPFGDANGFDFFEPNSLVTAVQRDAVGRFVLVLVQNNNTTAMARQNAAGIADAAFDNGNDLALDFAHIHGPSALALDGAGQSAYVVGVNAGGAPLAEHVNVNGTVDTAFGSAADEALAALGSAATGADAVAVLADGSVLVAGLPGYVARFHADGTLDTSFGSSGLASFGTFTSIAGLGVQSDNKIVVAGTVGAGSGSAVVTRLNASGALDPTYGTNSVVPAGIDGVSAIRMQPDDNVVVCGVRSGQFGAARLTF